MLRPRSKRSAKPAIKLPAFDGDAMVYIERCFGGFFTHLQSTTQARFKSEELSEKLVFGEVWRSLLPKPARRINMPIMDPVSRKCPGEGLRKGPEPGPLPIET